MPRWIAARPTPLHRPTIRCLWLGLVGAVALNPLSLSCSRVSPAAMNGDATDGRDPLAARAKVFAAGPGRVEPLSEEIRVATQVSGTLREVLVEEGDRVSFGQVLARVDSSEYRARAEAAASDLKIREAEARRVRNGARDEERREAEAAVREAQAAAALNQADWARLRDLARNDVISQQELDRGEERARVSLARLDAARERERVVSAQAREEDQTRADAAVAFARARLAEAQALLAKTDIRAPIAGVVLRCHRRAGESVSTQFDSPVVTVADRSRVRVRVDVDEADVARLVLGQQAYVTADAFGDRRFPGRVVRIGQVLGRKNFRTDEPTERIDTKVLETLVELEDGRELPIGLRVQAFVGPPD